MHVRIVVIVTPLGHDGGPRVLGDRRQQEDKWPTACPAVQWLLRGRLWLLTCLVLAALPSMVVARAGLQKRPDLIERLAAVRAQEAIVSDLDKALGQHVLEEAADELFGGKCPVFPHVAPAFLEPAGDLPVFQLVQCGCWGWPCGGCKGRGQ